MTRLVVLLALLPSLLHAQQTGPFTTVFKVGDTTVTEYGRVDSVRRVFPKPPVPAPTPTPTPTPTPPPQRIGVPFGCSGCLEADEAPPVTFSLDGYTASNLVSRISDARRRGIRLMLNLTGGAHSNYKTGGKFDVAKWQAKMQTYNTPAIKAAMTLAVRDGIVVGSSVMDEPHQVGTDEKAWGPEGWITKSKVDGLCGYVKSIFPTLPTGVVHDFSKLEPSVGYATCDLLASQYRRSKGDAAMFAKGSKAFTDKYHMALILMLNYLHGGTPSTSCTQYGDEAEGKELCPMTPAQIKTWGLLFGSLSCAVGGFRYEPEYFTRADVSASLKAVADSLGRLPAKSCRRTT